MKPFKLALVSFLTFCFVVSFSQNEKTPSKQVIKLDMDKVKMFEKYPKFKHDIESGGFEAWKNNNPVLYQKEMWYYTESFYIKRNHLVDGITLNEAAIDISRFEAKREIDKEVIITLDGFKDALILLPGNKLIYKPD